MSRRILSLPAVHPCTSISASTLLHSLIELCRSVSAFHSISTPSQCQIIRESIRQTSILQAFFEDVSIELLPRSCVLSLSEIHVGLQKLVGLLHDCCCRPGAKLYLLMNYQKVEYEFRSIARNISAALDVIPLVEIDVSLDVQEMVQLVSVQMWKGSFFTDADDCRAAAEVSRVLADIEIGVTPNRDCLKQILDNLWIRSWSECNEEIQFLEEEFFAGDAGVGGFIGLLVYCRAVMIDTLDSKKNEKEQVKLNELKSINVDDLRCPISLELMTDPVTISTGHTYDRKSIERWFAAGYLTCPVTGEKLVNSQFVPNLAIKSIVAQLSNSPVPDLAGQNRRRDLSKTSTQTSAAITMAAAVLVDKLKTGDNEDRNKAAFEIRLLCKSSLYNRACFVEAGSVPWLLYLLYSSDSSTQENAVAALLNLSKHPDGRVAINESGGVALIVDVIRDGIKLEAQQNAAGILFYLSSVAEFRREIGESPDAIPTLIELLNRSSFRGKKNVLVTLFGLLLFPGNYRIVLAAGAVPAIAGILSSDRDELVADSAAVLAKLAERREGTNPILSSSAVPQMVEVLRSSASQPAREYCVTALLSLCNNGGQKVVSLLEKMPLLMSALYSLVTEGSPQAGKKARLLLNQIHRLHDQDYPVMPASREHDRIIHAQ